MYPPKKADIWAIGVILFILVTGRMPFDETKGNSSLLDEHRRLDLQWPRVSLWQNQLSHYCSISKKKIQHARSHIGLLYMPFYGAVKTNVFICFLQLHIATCDIIFCDMIKLTLYIPSTMMISELFQ